MEIPEKIIAGEERKMSLSVETVEGDKKKDVVLDPQREEEKHIPLSPEEKEEKFKEIGEKRVSKVCKGIRLIGNLSNRSAYAYEQKNVDKMFSAIETVLAETKAKFQQEKNSEDFRFD